MNFILSEHDVLGLRASTIRGKVSAILFFHLVMGKNDFTRAGARWEFLIKGLDTVNKTVNRRLPYNTELLEFGRKKLLIDSPSSDHRFDRAWVATLVGFMFLLRASELDALRVKDITFGEHEGARYVGIFIRKSKTDQEEFGVFRSLNETNKTLRPYSRLKSWVDRINPEDRKRTFAWWRHSGNGHPLGKMVGSRTQSSFMQFFNSLFTPRWINVFAPRRS